MEKNVHEPSQSSFSCSIFKSPFVNHFVRVITPEEMYVIKLFRELGIPVLQKQVFCFLCRSFWESDNERPEACLKCGKIYNDYGQYSKPDIVMVLRDPKDVGGAPESAYGVVRVGSENLHKKNKKHTNHDYFQYRDFLEAGIKVFDIWNDELKVMPVWATKCVLKFFQWCVLDDSMYRLYTSDADIKNRFRKI